MKNLRSGPLTFFKRNPIPILSCILALLFIAPYAGADTTVGGTISSDTTWVLSESPYIVTSNIIIRGTDGADAITTLTIEPGVEIRFNGNRQLKVGASSGDPGALKAQGTATDPIIFTSSQSAPAPGNWKGIKFYTTTDDSNTILEHCTVQYAGYGNQGQVYVDDAAPRIRNCRFANSSNYDLYYDGTVGGTVSDSTLNSGIYLLATSTVDFTGNTFNHNNSYPTITYADYVGAVVSGNTFSNLDETSYLEVNSGTISHDASWSSAIPYKITGNITVKGTDGADAVTTLVVEPGAKLLFNDNRQLKVGASSGDPGALKAQGTAADPVIFTSSQSAPAPGNWRGIKFYTTTDDSNTILEHCTVQYAGYGNLGQVYVDDAAPSIRNCRFTNSSNYDLYYDGTVGGTVSDSTLNSGIYLLANSTVDFTGNTFNHNNSYPTIAYADYVGAVVSGNTFSNLDETSYLEVISGTISHDASWSSAIPYKITGNITVKGTDGADAVTTLTVGPGAKLLFDGNRQLKVGASSGDPGALKAQGTAADPVIFTSSQSAPAPGNWRGIKFYATTDDGISELRYCVVEYAGYGNQGLVYLYNAKPSISYSTFRFSAHAGVYAYGTGSSDTDINCNTFANNSYGVYSSGSALPLIHQNNFSGNADYGVYNDAAQTINAEDNWWGDIQGPNTGGDTTYGNVDSDPWSAAENQCSGSSENYPPFAPASPVPVDQAVRIPSESGVNLSWSCSDPNSGDTLTYAIYVGTSLENLQLVAEDLGDPTYPATGLSSGSTYFWQVVSKDNGGLSTAGPKWQFTTNGDPPDITVSDLTTAPSGGMQANSWVTLTATITNIGSGPVVDSFDTAFSSNGAVIGTVTTHQVIAPGAGAQVSFNWYYTGGDPDLEVTADSSTIVSETVESNNRLQALLSAVADITAPSLTGHSPVSGSEVQQVQLIHFSLADTQSAIDDPAVMAFFALVDASQQAVTGSISESNDTFTFVPDTLPLTDGNYAASISATDSFGNTKVYSLSFTIDTVPPAKPVITGSEVSSGTIRPRPAANTADRVLAVVEGTRDSHTSIWVNGERKVPLGSEPWSCQIGLTPGNNSFEIISHDGAGNPSAPEWVDIHFSGQGGVAYEYDAAGRVKRINVSPSAR